VICGGIVSLLSISGLGDHGDRGDEERKAEPFLALPFAEINHIHIVGAGLVANTKGLSMSKMAVPTTTNIR